MFENKKNMATEKKVLIELMSRGFTFPQAQKIIQLNKKHAEQVSKKPVKYPSTAPVTPIMEASTADNATSFCKVAETMPNSPEELFHCESSDTDLYMASRMRAGTLFSPILEDAVQQNEHHQVNIFKYNNSNNSNHTHHEHHDEHGSRHESFSAEILIALQKAKYGMCMYDLVTERTQAEVTNSMKSSGLSFDEAVLLLFNRYQAARHKQNTCAVGDGIYSPQRVATATWSHAEIEALREKFLKRVAASTTTSPLAISPPLTLQHVSMTGRNALRQYPSPVCSPATAASKPLKLSKRNPFSSNNRATRVVTTNNRNQQHVM